MTDQEMTDEEWERLKNSPVWQEMRAAVRRMGESMIRKREDEDAPA